MHQTCFHHQAIIECIKRVSIIKPSSNESNVFPSSSHHRMHKTCFHHQAIIECIKRVSIIKPSWNASNVFPSASASGSEQSSESPSGSHSRVGVILTFLDFLAKTMKLFWNRFSRNWRDSIRGHISANGSKDGRPLEPSLIAFGQEQF